MVKGKQDVFPFVYLLESLSEQGAGDVNVCPGIKRPLIVCCTLWLKTEKTYFHLGSTARVSL